ncbi:hypothetical protein KIH31_00145 [Paenarthrobacter sp. DKR-5]|nr:hypothetical protein [Paenarthrobacter sp. DKR-5]
MPVVATTIALLAGSLLAATPAAEASAQVFNPCEQLSNGQVKYPTYGAQRVTFATTPIRQTYHAVVTTCVKSGSRYVQEWQVNGTVGQSGFVAPGVASGPTIYEFSPTGSFSVTEGFGLGNPGTRLKYHTLNPGSRWGGHPWTANYNQYFEQNSYLADFPDENMWYFANRLTRDYQQGVVINYNREPGQRVVQDAGFAIFLHSNTVPTAGCVAIPPDMVTRYLREATPGDRIIMGAVDDVFSPRSSVLNGAIHNYYLGTGGQLGFLGQPLTNEYGNLRGGGAFQTFQGGTVTWAPGTGLHLLGGGIRSEWSSTGAQNGPLLYPTGDEVRGLRAGGAYQTFQGGVVTWSPAAGAHMTRGAIRGTYGAAGYEDGSLGYPTSDEYATSGGGREQNYQGGRIIWSPATGAHLLTGGFGPAYAALGGPASPLGFPVGDEVRNQRDGGSYQLFQGGRLTWSAATGVHYLTGAIGAKYAAAGAVSSLLGYPTTDPAPTRTGGAYQSFQGGSIHWSAATGAHITYGPIRTAWAAGGWENGKLGYPTSDLYTTAGGFAQDFQGGRISLSSAGVVTVTYPAPAPAPAPTPSPSPTPVPTATATPTPSDTAQPTPTDTATSGPAPTATPTATATDSVLPTP